MWSTTTDDSVETTDNSRQTTPESRTTSRDLVRDDCRPRRDKSRPGRDNPQPGPKGAKTTGDYADQDRDREQEEVGLRPKHQLPSLPIHLDGIPLVELPIENIQRQRIQQVTLNAALQRPRPVYRIIPLARQVQLRRIRQHKAYLLIRQ